MRLRRLESRIVLLFLSLILAVQLGSFVAIQGGIQQSAHHAISDQLIVGERVFQRLVEQNAQRLTQGARLLAVDPAFHAAVGSNNHAAVSSALSNHAMRMGATFAVLSTTDHRVRAGTPFQLSPALERSVTQIIEMAELDGNAADIALADGRPMQLVVVPIKSPLIIGWIVMGFPIDQRFAADLQALTSLHVSIVTRNPRGDWVMEVTTMAPEEGALLIKQVQHSDLRPGEIHTWDIGGTSYGSRPLNLTRANEQNAVVLLQRSVNEITAPYRQLQIGILLVSIAGIILALIASIVTAKRITDPLRQLGDTARRLGTGDYDAPIAVSDDEEIHALSQAFANMRDGIANREQEIKRLAYWDTLTGLPNRAEFTNVLQRAITDAIAENGGCFVLMLDLDRFKHVNDVLGRSFGDLLLRKLAERLSHQIRGDADMLARLGGDEFAVLLYRADTEDAQAVAARLLSAFEKPIALEEQAVDIGAGIGIAGFPGHGADAETLLRRAEIAMYWAKAHGSGAVFYDPSIDQGSQTSLSMLSELRQALDRNELQLHLQPKIRLDSGEVVGAEALLRWAHPERGNIFPDVFIPFAERTGFIRVLTNWVLEQSAILCKSFNDAGVCLRLSINLSTRDLLNQELPVKLLDILNRHDIPASSFCLEITESAIMDDPVRAQQTLERLHALGFELSIDDFGTGYSSLAYLKQLPVDELKIDKSFVMNMAHDDDDRKIVRSTIDLGHNMGLRVVAEGIESAQAWKLLGELNCDLAQGNFMSCPLPAEQFLEWLRGWQPPSSKDTVLNDNLGLEIEIDVPPQT